MNKGVIVPVKPLGEILVRAIALAVFSLIYRYFSLRNEKRLPKLKQDFIEEMSDIVSDDVITFLNIVYTTELGDKIKKINIQLRKQKISVRQYDERLASILECYVSVGPCHTKSFFSKMVQYNVFQSLYGEYEAVRQGRSWSAFFFLPIWVVSKKMFFHVNAFAVFIFMWFVIIKFTGISVAWMCFFGLAAHVVYFLNGNSWYEASLASRGFEQVATVTDKNAESAITRYLNTRYLKAALSAGK